MRERNKGRKSECYGYCFNKNAFEISVYFDLFQNHNAGLGYKILKMIVCTSIVS